MGGGFLSAVVINFTIIGMFAGVYIGLRVGSPLWGGIVTTMILGGMCLPLMKYSVSLLGAGAGAILGAAIWAVDVAAGPADLVRGAGRAGGGRVYGLFLAEKRDYAFHLHPGVGVCGVGSPGPC